MQFTPGSLHTATVTFANQAGVPFSYAVSFCLGATQVEVARVSFSIPGGKSLNVLFGITMPSTAGSYPVYLKVSSGGKFIKTFATEAVVIAAPAFDPWVYDVNGDGYISKIEATYAAVDYFDNKITKAQMDQVNYLYLNNIHR